MLVEQPDKAVLAEERRLIAQAILWRRFGPLPLDLDTELGGLTASQAEFLVDVALEVSDLTAFQATLVNQTRKELAG